jgi:magnesium transporter
MIARTVAFTLLDNKPGLPEHEALPMSRFPRRPASILPIFRARIHPGTLPGTLPAVEKTVPARVSVITFTRDAVEEKDSISVEEAIAAVRVDGVTWINVDGIRDPTVLARLGERFSLHPLALEDAVNVGQRPKVERYDKHYFMVLRTMRVEPAAADIVEEQVSVFFGAHWVITVQEHPDGGDCFGSVRAAIRQGRGRVREAGADYLAYLLLDSVVDAYFPVIETMAEAMHELESAAIVAVSTETLMHIQRVRRQLLSLRRAVWPMREEIGILQREESPLIAPETHIFLRDAYDHAIQALEIVESLRETATNVMEIYLSAQNQRLNEVMKVLTVIATLFIPLTFIASIYGMNFQHMPELHWRYGYPFALGLMAAAATVMLVYFRRRGWW